VLWVPGFCRMLPVPKGITSEKGRAGPLAARPSKRQCQWRRACLSLCIWKKSKRPKSEISPKSQRGIAEACIAPPTGWRFFDATAADLRTWACSPIPDNCNCASNGHGINLGFGKPSSLRACESKGCSFKGAAAATYFSRLGRVLCSFESP
jgi:hypothetical protein